ncbi:MAG: Ig domain-containing protein [Clostridiales bacterium]|nr:Ig domain-containing protein [Clostridiales bacterium]
MTDSPIPTSYGTSADSGGKITVDGAIVNTLSRYAYVGSQLKAKGNDSTHALPFLAKPGYLTYTDDGTNVVWVKEEGGAPVIATPGGPLRSGKAGDMYSAHFAAATDGGGSVTWKVHSGALPPGLELFEEDGYIHGMPTAPGLYSFSLTVENGYGISAPVSFSIEIANAANPLTISPTHAILTNTEDWAHFEVALNIPNPDYANIDWIYPDWIDFEEIYDPGSRDYSIRLETAGLVPGTFTIVASYNDTYSGDTMYSATATVEVIPGGIGAGTTAKVLETKVTVNKAKETGALVPVLITDQKPYDMGLSAFSVGGGSSEPQTGSRIAAVVELYKKNSKTKAWDVPLPGYTANMYGADQRYIEINADESVKNNKAVKAKVILRSADGAVALDAGIISLTAVRKWPKFTVKAGALNLFLPQNTAALTVTAADGSKCFVNGITPPAGKDYFTYEAGKLRLETGAKKGSFKTKVNISVTGYKAVPASKMPKVNVKIVNTAPKVKLAKSSVKLLRAEDFGGPAGSAAIRLVTADKKVPFESGYKVADVTSGRADIDVTYKNGVIYITPLPNCKSGKATLYVEFQGVTGTKKLTLNVTVRKIKDLKPASKVKSVKVNRENMETPPENFVADIPISLGVDNYSANDWVITPSHGRVTTGILDGAILFVNGDNKLTVRLHSATELADLLAANGGRDVKYKLTIKSPSLTSGKSFSVNLTLTEKAITGKIKTKGKIDVANPNSAVTATLTLTNTSSKIASVQLYKGSMPSDDFMVTGISGNTFKIVAAHKGVVPGVQQALVAEVTLKNSFAGVSNVKLKIKPVQGKGKATQSRKSVTLYKSTPMYGSGPIKLDLKKPANAKLGAVSVNQASVKGMKFSEGGYRLERNGSNDYSICFDGGRAPVVTNKKTGKLGKLKSSYTLKLDLWADGTYTLDGNGQPVALGYYNASGKWVAKSKPTTVKVKVVIK